VIGTLPVRAYALAIRTSFRQLAGEWNCDDVMGRLILGVDPGGRRHVVGRPTKSWQVRMGLHAGAAQVRAGTCPAVSPRGLVDVEFRDIRVAGSYPG